MNITGNFQITHRNADGKVLSESVQHNLIVDAAMTDVIMNAFTMAGTGAKPIYRCGIGSGGYTDVIRTLPNDTWNAKTDMVIPVGSEDIDTQTYSWDASSHILKVENVTTFDALSYGLAGTDINEVCLIAGNGSAGVRLGTTHIGAGDIMFSYHTTTNKPMNIGDTMTVNWNICFRKEV